MLSKRIITATILTLIMVAAVFLLPTIYFSALITLVVLMAGWEWTGLCGIHKILHKCLFLFILLLPILALESWTHLLELLAALLDWPEIKNYSGILEWLVILPVLFWLTMMVLIRKVPDELLALNLKVTSKAFAGWFILFFAWMFLNRLRALYGVEMVMYFFVLIWSADIAAYFVGNKYGKDKLAEQISPGKTVQGMYGALITGAVCGVLLGLYYRFPLMIASDFLLLSVLTVLISIYGDLFISIFKRQKGVKDSGALLPGHGGILDRIDSVIAAIPFFYAGILLIGRSVFS